MKKLSLLLPALVTLALNGFADDSSCCTYPHGWSFELGGQYTWLSFTTPPTFKGSSGGAIGKITYQTPDAFFGELRSVYNGSTLSSPLSKSSDSEWYAEFIAGYSFSLSSCWTITPYAGFGFDRLNDHKRAYDNISAIGLHYNTYYALLGFETHYMWSDDWSLGLEAEALPVCQQYLNIGGLPGAAWQMNERWGVAVRFPVGYSFSDHFSLELAPYYRLLPIGGSSLLELPSRTLNQWGGFLTLKYAL